MNTEIIDDLKAFNWQTIIDYGRSLDDLNDSQWRFLKGLVIELTIEKHSNDPTFKYVGAVHKDYEWSKHNIAVELKSQMSAKMYTSKGHLRPNFSVKLSNSMGTNTKRRMTRADVADVLVVVTDNGAYAISQKTLLANQKKLGDGFSVTVTSADIIELSGVITKKTTYANGIKQAMMAAITAAIP